MKKNENFQSRRTVEFSKTSSSDVQMHEYLDQISRDCAKGIVDYIFREANSDQRIIALGGGDLEIVGHIPFVNPPDKTADSMWINPIFQEMLLSLSAPKSIFVTALDFECIRINDAQQRFGSRVTTLNNKHLFLFEQFMKPTYETFESLKYEAIDPLSMDDIKEEFDYMSIWNMDVENRVLGPGDWIDMLKPGGILVLQNVSDANFLYVDKTSASGIWEFHEDIKNRDDCYMYHVPLYYGFTIIKKNPATNNNWDSYYKSDYSGSAV